MSTSTHPLDQEKLEQLQGKVIGDVAGSVGLLLAYLSDKFDLHSALREIRPATRRFFAPEAQAGPSGHNHADETGP